MKIKEIRIARGITQVELAKLVGYTQAQVSRIENGTRRLTTDKLHAFGKALGVNSWDILNDWQPRDLFNQEKKGGIMKKLFKKIISFIAAPFMWVALGVRGFLAFILRNCFNCMVVYPKKKGKKNGK